MRAAITRSLWTKTHHAPTDNAAHVGHWQPYGEANTMANNPNDRGMQNPNQAQQGQGKQASSQAPQDKQKTQNLGSQDQKKQGQNLGSQDRGTSGGMSGSS